MHIDRGIYTYAYIYLYNSITYKAQNMESDVTVIQSEAFVYRWRNLENGKVYIGKHKGSEDDGYISSGKAFLAVYNTNPHIFVRDILARGTNEYVLQEEQRLIREQIELKGYDSCYNLTTWSYLKTWKRTCLHCGAIVDPRNEEWLAAFNKIHFENCSINTSRKPKTDIKRAPKDTLANIEYNIRKLMDLQRIEIDPNRTELLRELRTKKRKLLK